MKVKKRLDVLLTEQGYADTRSKAQAIIMSGQVYVNGQKADKPGVSYEETVELEVRGAVCPYVSRGGLKLEKALRDFGVKPEGYVCSDSGASQAVSRIACCSRVPKKCLQLMLATASWTGSSALIPELL